MANLAVNKAPGERKGRRQPRSYQELCSISGTTASRHATVTDTPPDRDQHPRNQTPGPISPETLGQWVGSSLAGSAAAARQRHTGQGERVSVPSTPPGASDAGRAPRNSGGLDDDTIRSACAAAARSYVALLVLAAIIGVSVSAATHFFLALVGKLQVWIFADLPKGPGLPRRTAVVADPVSGAGRATGRTDHPVPARHGRPLPSRRVQDGHGADRTGRVSRHRALRAGDFDLGVVLEPEAPMIALGGPGVLAVRLVKRDARPELAPWWPQRGTAVGNTQLKVYHKLLSQPWHAVSGPRR
jgi:hypothetical protein